MTDNQFLELFPEAAIKEIRERIDEHKDSHISVKEFLGKAKGFLEDEFPYVSIRGEVSNLALPRSGHCYFTLKDDEAQLRAVMFHGQRLRSGYTPKDGEEVIVYGRPTIYTPRGDLQILVDSVVPYGLGMLERAFEELKAKLQQEGLFDPEIKKPIPQFPERIFVVTSPTGAAIRDFIKTARQRLVTGEIILCPTRVQGDGADQEIIEAIDAIEKIATSRDVVVITRGGGSREDLWAYNSELLARRIFKCSIPVISAVGHEVDFTIADFVADVRAQTPTAAAQVLFPELNEYAERLAHLSLRLSKELRHKIFVHRDQLMRVSKRLKDPMARIYEKRIFIDELTFRKDRALARVLNRYQGIVRDIENSLKKAIGLIVEDKRQRFERLTASLEALSPLKVLSRGYSIVTDEYGAVVKKAADVTQGQRLLIRPYKGRIKCIVEETSS